MTTAELAEPGQRLVARLIDTLIVGVPVALIAPLLLAQDPDSRSTETAIAIGVAALYLPYDAVQIALWGRTVGKRLTGISVISAVGPAPIGVPRAVLRATVFALPIAASRLPVLGVLAGIFWVVNAGIVLVPNRSIGTSGTSGDSGSQLEAPRRAVHDRLVNTVVVRS
jgi:uncharacterized RDD family membrane protein YckC